MVCRVSSAAQGGTVQYRLSAMFTGVIHLTIAPDAHGVAWRKSRRSMNDGNCVEVAVTPNGIHVRDSVNRAGIVLGYPSRTWRAFLMQAKNGKFDIEAGLPGRQWARALVVLTC